MANITITLTDTQLKGLEYISTSPQDWADNALHNRARIAVEEIIANLVTHCNANSVALAVGEDAQVAQAFELGVAKTAAQRNAEASELPK